MLIRRLVIVLGILLVPTAAYADGHRAGVFGGISFARGSLVTGFHAAGDYSFGDDPDSPYVGISLDISSHFIGDDPTKQVFMVGASYGLARTDRLRKFVPVPHVMFGGVHVEGADTVKAFAVGASHDFILPSNSARSNATHYAIRVQYDRILLGDDMDDFDRYSIGVVIRSARR